MVVELNDVKDDGKDVSNHDKAIVLFKNVRTDNDSVFRRSGGQINRVCQLHAAAFRRGTVLTYRPPTYSTLTLTHNGLFEDGIGSVV
jgi:hypothetical protein